jgi:hypothetical protein
MVGVWICQPCGQQLRTADTTYDRGWAWRGHYSACGGYGAGLGEGNEGVECGRGKGCQAAQETFQEIECKASELAALQCEAESEGRQWAGSSYMTQEIMGIGGSVKMKVKKRVLVGAAVKEYTDERESHNFLVREQTGINRSWCSWCERVIPGKKDTEGAMRSSDSIASSGSASST